MRQESIIKSYESIEKAWEDNEKMKSQGFNWFSGWYEIDGYSVEFTRYIKEVEK